MAAVRQASPLTDASKVAPWLYRLAVRQSLLYRRRMGRTRKLHVRYAQHVFSGNGEGDHASESNPLTWLLADERRALVRQALDPPWRRDAEILLLKYTEPGIRNHLRSIGSLFRGGIGWLLVPVLLALWKPLRVLPE